jgi:predicted deacetylase
VINPRELDDVHPLIIPDPENCPELRASKWLWLIPSYDGEDMDAYKDWCQTIKAMGKKLGMHGVRHTYKEFASDLSEAYVQSGVDVFERAFGYRPRYFKAPKLEMTRANRKIVEQLGMEVKGAANQYTRVVYHTKHDRLKNGRLRAER